MDSLGRKRVPATVLRLTVARTRFPYAVTSPGQALQINGVEPQAYIADVIAKIAGDWPASRWDELMPWNWRRHADISEAQAA
jgi:hypothetical protein